MVPKYNEPLSLTGKEQKRPEETFHQTGLLKDVAHKRKKSYRRQNRIHHRVEPGQDVIR